MTDVRYLEIDEMLAIARVVNGSEHGVRDMGHLVSAIERPRTNVFGVELEATPHEKAAALLHSVARNHPLIGGNKPTALPAMRVFLRFNGVSAGAVPPSVFVAGPFVEEVAQDTIDVPTMAKSFATWFWFPVA
ncbi:MULTISPECIES: type II toxin-antitoxin system death-on-curing family toxin [Streptomyces]|uniref:Fic family protein n=1 Tax=Streptomyces rochei TaxID=1928 RepID=A0AAX3ZQ13_STRRO|nr:MULTISPECIES: Fic family protein [Streptomyces]MBQ0879608.1 Fic family protein [Streptomyces sp. RT42]MDI3098596.1 Fic family protein [Streptomyces sp. AN-3]RSS10939.1 toxin [Streptomyces sp. WAC05458]WMC89025.1 Fic family protein [Streptomyces rochei]